MSLTGENKAIKFPKNHYVGMIGRPGDILPLGFMTPDGTDKQAQKRKDSVNNWVLSNTRHNQDGKVIAHKRTLENTPLIGFRLTRQIKRDSGWGSGNVKWRIEDPRGFELEITSPNMARVIDSCVIDNGEILEECVWARLGAENILVPVSSDLYQAAQRNEERVSSKVKPSQVERGDYVVLQNGTEGVYLGKFEKLERSYSRDSGRRMFSYGWKNKPVHVMITKNKDHQGNEVESVHSFATFKPSYVTKREGGPMTPEAAEQMVWNTVKGMRYSNDLLYLNQAPIEYQETLTTLPTAMSKDRFGHLICKKGDDMYSISLQKWQYDEYKNPRPQQRGFGSYSSDRLRAQINKVTRTEDGDYVVHYPSNDRYGTGRRDSMSIDELEQLPIFFVTATVETSDGKQRVLS